ncbi:alpha/beta hydrolase [Nocardia arthritidis]|uniref:Alpha/beta fold hydrolase n=1 Tax=Nocardia arthritidis TaxID=228602 RepID=A0A6G9YKF6_9NOCA|nr:alpha/beta hydrolase [Nocardia arthritidis]QIS13684.1 alpha/beta fold hydrolase [Nocardia arthritidis]
MDDRPARRNAWKTGRFGCTAVWCGGAALILVAALCVAADTTGLARYYQQRLHWHACKDDGLAKEGASCAEVMVPLDYGNPSGPTLSVAISRIEARDKANRRGILLSNPGGPGGSGMDAFDLIGDVLEPDVLARYDLIGFDPRGVERSGKQQRCGWPVANPIRSAGVDRAGFVSETLLQADLAASCLQRDQNWMRHLSTRNTARDMDVIRGALAEPRLSYYGLSYGTYLGEVYTQLFPGRSDRIVLDSVIDPDRYWLGLQQDWGPAVEAGFDDWAAWTADRDETYHLGASAGEVRGTVEALIAHAAETPIVVEGFAFDDHLIPNLLWEMLRDARLNEPVAQMMRALADAAEGRAPDVPKRLHQQIVSAKEDEYSVMAQIWCADAPMPRDPAWYWDAIQRARPTQPIFGALANNIQPCAFWPAPLEPPTVVRNAVPALILQATGDNRTPYRNAVALHRQMTRSRLITLRNTRIHMVFRTGLSTCVLETTNAYFRDGTIPAADLDCDPN